MKPELRIVSGSPASTILVFSQSHIAIGRHPESDIAFDPRHDIEVSVRHAAILKHGDHWIVRDLGSRNGTLVNGHPITGDTKLCDTDHIRLGPGGPVIECRLVADHVPDTGKSLAGPAGKLQRTPLTKPTPTTPRGKQGTTQRVRVAVALQTRRLRGITVGLFVVLAGVTAGLLFMNRQQRLMQERELAGLQARIDSVLQAARETVAALQQEMSELASTVEDSRQEIQSLQLSLTQAREAGNEERIQALTLELDNALVALAVQQHAASIDFAGIARSNQGAVAMMFVDFGGGRIETSTAFAVRSDGTMLTTRHSVVGPRGNLRARQIGVRFADSKQTFRARVTAVAEGEDADLAIIKVELRGEVPAVQGLNQRPDTVAVGAPVAIIGFPGGTGSPQLVRDDGTYATPSLTAGTVSKNLPALIQISGYGTQGTSGSPIFDANGKVIGIVNAGEVGSAGRIVYAVPVSLARELLAR